MASNPARDAIARFFDAQLDVEAVLRALVLHGPWLVPADAGRLSAFVMAGKPQIWAFTDREALDVFLAAGGAKIRTRDGKSFAETIESWPHGFYVFHDFADGTEHIRVNPMCGAPIGFDVEPRHFALARRIGREALIADVLRTGPSDPRFRNVLSTHADYRVIVFQERLISVELEGGTRAVVVFTSQTALDRFLVAHPPKGDHMIAVMDAKVLFGQLRDHQIVFDLASPHQLALGREIADFVLPR
jgi:hypothetical protein